MSCCEISQVSASSTLVSNGLVDFRGKPADRRKTGGWKAAPFVIVQEMVERLAFFAIVVTLGKYFHDVMHLSLPDSMTHVTDWVGAGHLLTLLGAFIADAFIGRFMTIVIFSIIFAVGMVMLTLAASIEGFQPPAGLPATRKQELFLYGALALIAIGTGGIKPCVSTFGADQFDENDVVEAKKKYSFFNWFYLAINLGALLGIGVVGFLAQRKGASWGFGVPAAAGVISIMVVVAGYRLYRFQKPMGSPLTRFAQVIVAACRSHSKGIVVGKDVRDGELYEVSTMESDIVGAPKLSRTRQYGFFDKAAVVTEPQDINTSNRWRLCTVTQVEEFKCIIRFMPIVITTTALSISFSQMSTFFTMQSNIMNRNLMNKTFPPGSVTLFATLNPVIVIPIYVRIVFPILRKFTGRQRGITSLQRIGVGLFISIFAMASAALVERKRLNHPDPKSMSFLWLVPQIFLIGTAEVFTYVGQLEFFYDESSQGTRSISTAIFMSQSGIGHLLSTALVKSVQGFTGGVEMGWLRNDLNRSHLDYFYWVLCWINAINLVFYLWAASTYKGRDDDDDDCEKNVGGDKVRDEEKGPRRHILNN